MGTIWARARRIAAAAAAALLVGALLPGATAAAATVTLVELRISQRTVDVTSGAAYVTVKAKLARTGGLDGGEVLIALLPSDGQASPNYQPVASTEGPSTSGSPAWFTATFRIPRYSSPTVYDVMVDVADRVGLGSTTFTRTRLLTVTCLRPDTTLPTVRWLKLSAPSGFPLDVRSSARSVRVTMRITDDLAGVTPSTIDVRLRHIIAPGVWFGAHREIPVTRTAGTARDGWYTGTWQMSKGDLVGDWALDLVVTDRAHSVGATYTTDLVRERGTRAMPGHTGTFRVKGGYGESSRPALASVRMSPTAVLRTAADGSVTARITVTARVKDQGSGVRRVVAVLSREGVADAVVVKERMRPTSGTRYDGIWTFTLDVPATARMWVPSGCTSASTTSTTRTGTPLTAQCRTAAGVTTGC